MRFATAAALLLVANPLFAQVNPPVITKTFSDPTRPVGYPEGVFITITNPNADVSLTGVGFTDSLPAGSVVSSNLTNTCNGTPAVVGSSVVSLSGVTLSPNGSCDWAFVITFPTPGVITNSVQVTSSNGGTGNTATATATVFFPQVVTKSFAASSIPPSVPPSVAPNRPTTMTITIQNPNPSPFTLGNVNDPLPAGLVISPAPNATNSCGGAFNPAPGDTLINFNFGPLAASATCSVSVDVTGTTEGLFSNNATVFTQEGGNVLASAMLAVVAPDLAITKSHAANFTQGETGATYIIDVDDVSTSATDGSTVTVNDALPAGLTATSISGTGWNCTLATLTCTRSDVLPGLTAYPPIQVVVDVSRSAGTTLTNSATVSGGGDTNARNNTANDVTNVVQSVPALSPLMILMLGAAIAFVAMRAIAQR